METAITAALVSAGVSLLTAIVTTIQTTRLQDRQYRQELEKQEVLFQQELQKQTRSLADDFHRDREQYRTQFMAERVVVELLQQPNWHMRSFNQIERRLKGFEHDELRKILVRAGAICLEGSGGQELWGLLSRPEVRKALGNRAIG
jgi:Tfp pilus assembly protein PilN